MATSTRLRGNINPIFTLKLGAGTAASFSDDLKNYTLSSDEKDDSDLTFAEAAAGTGADWTLSITALVSNDTGSLFAYLWANPGVDLLVVLAPHGNATPAATKPHYTFTMNTGFPPDLSNEAKGGSDVSGAEFEKEFKISTQITRLVA